MASRLSQRWMLCAVLLTLAVSAAGCGSGDEATDEELFGDTATTAGPKPAVEGRFEADNHKLYLQCTGAGSPTVVFLHGSVQDAGGAGSRAAGRLPALLGGQHRVCVYDRANVGRSDRVRGPLTGRQAAKDLHALLASAKIRGPYVLVGQSLGGAIADLYTAAYPDDVAGMVLLDSTLPAYLDMYKRLYPPGSGPQPGQWKREAERLDRLATFRQAGTIQGRRAKIPVTYIAAKLVVAPKIAAVIRRAQEAFVKRFTPGRRIEVEADHSMIPTIPEQIAHEIEQVLAVAEQG